VPAKVHQTIEDGRCADNCANGGWSVDEFRADNLSIPFFELLPSVSLRCCAAGARKEFVKFRHHFAAQIDIERSYVGFEL